MAVVLIDVGVSRDPVGSKGTEVSTVPVRDCLTVRYEADGEFFLGSTQMPVASLPSRQTRSMAADP